MMMLQSLLSTWFMCVLYSASVVPCHACTSSPSDTSAAATSSCVDRGLLPVMYISAPPLFNTSQRYAVFASRCTESAIFFPAKGFSFSKSFFMPVSKGQLRLTHSIFLRPDSARFISFISEFIYAPIFNLLTIYTVIVIITYNADLFNL